MSRLKDKAVELLTRIGEKADPIASQIYSGWSTYRYEISSRWYFYRWRQRKRWGIAFRWFTVEHMGLLLGVLAIGVIIGGALVQYGSGFSARQMAVDLWANFGTELIGIAITVLIIDALNRRRERRKEVGQEKSSVYFGLRSSIPEEVQLAVEKMRNNGWHSEDFLAGANLSGANLSGRELSWSNLEKAWLPEADMSKADLRWARLGGANLQRANLQRANLLDAQLIMTNLVEANLQGAKLQMASLLGADIRHANLEGARLEQANLQAAKLVDVNLKGASVSEGQLMFACSMKEAIMPDGNIYDGRYSLEGDLEWAQLNGLNPESPEDMAGWYLVTPEKYLEGQAWFKRNHDRLLADWKYVIQHHGPMQELIGICSPSIAEREVLSHLQSVRMMGPKIRRIPIERDETPPRKVDESQRF